MFQLKHRLITFCPFFHLNEWLCLRLFVLANKSFPITVQIGSMAAGLTQTKHRWPSQTTVSQMRLSFWEQLLPPSLPHSRPEKFNKDIQNYVKLIHYVHICLYLLCKCICGCHTEQSSGTDVWLHGRVLPLGGSCFSYSLNWKGEHIESGTKTRIWLLTNIKGMY